jgi:hypothetical protein
LSFDTTILTKYVKDLSRLVEGGGFADALVGAMNTGNGLMQQRIFTRNEDVEGQSFGVYIGRKAALGQFSQSRLLTLAKSATDRRRVRRAAVPLTPYQRKRVLRGRQVLRKDLELEGDLRRSIQVFVENDRTVVLAFNDDHQALIASGQEQQIHNIRQGRKGTTRGTGAPKIFALNENEIDETKEQGVELVLQLLK